jgi:hypothetical protein
MNKIISEHYPARQLPKDLRPDDGPNARAPVTIEVEGQRPEHILSRGGIGESTTGVT